FLFACYADSLIIGIIGAFLCAGLCGLLFSFLTVKLQANQNVTGLAMTIFGVGLYQFIGQTMKTKGTFPMMSERLCAIIADKPTTVLGDIPYVGELLFSYNPLVYVAIAVAILVWIYVRFTRTGLKVRAIGENPAAADGVGININRGKFSNVIIGSGISGIGGLYMAMVIHGGAWNDYWINGYGWISIALVIFANWSSARAIFGSLLFGIMLALETKVSTLMGAFPKMFGWLGKLPKEFYQMLPFITTALVLIISSMRKRKDGVQPAAIGVNYYREDR
ncbi:MAG: ABC transporter permease, partial [Clostridia bacterium]